MPEIRHLLRIACLSRAIASTTWLLTLPGCHLFVTPPASNPRGPDASQLSTRPVLPRTVPRTELLQLEVDSSSSTASFSITLDPRRLAARRSTSVCPLKGTVTGTLETSLTGSHSFTIENIDLVTAGNSQLEFDWSPLIGTVRILIPAGILTIRDHTIPGAIPLHRDGQFSHPACRFRVGGSCQVEGTGLVLKKKVGKMEGDLTIEETESVTLAGSLTRRDDTWILDMPSTVMKDRFEVDEEGTIMELTFTGRIVAVNKKG